MYNRSSIITSLSGLVGYKSPANPSYDFLDAANKVSRSGRYVTDNTFAKIEYFKDNFDYEEADDAQLNQGLSELMASAITSVCDKVFDLPDYIDRQVLFQFPNNKITTDTVNAGSFVGYRIQTNLNKTWAFNIKNIYLEFDGIGDLKLYLFHTSKRNSIDSKTISITSTNQKESLNWNIDYTSDYYKGDFYIGYFQEELGSLLPINRDYENANVKSVYTGICLTNIEVPSATINELWDLDDVENVSECHGLNPDILIYNDYTETIIVNESLLAQVIQKQAQINFLSNIITSNRSNHNQRLSGDMVAQVMGEIEGIDDTNKTGLKSELAQDLTLIKKDIRKIINGLFSSGFLLNTQT